MGIDHYRFKDEGKDYLKLFSNDNQGITRADLEKVFLRYLAPQTA